MYLTKLASGSSLTASSTLPAVALTWLDLILQIVSTHHTLKEQHMTAMNLCSLILSISTNTRFAEPIVVSHPRNGNYSSRGTYQFCTLYLSSLRETVPKGFDMITSIKLHTNKVLKLPLHPWYNANAQSLPHHVD
jgi:hypothetical protein